MVKGSVVANSPLLYALIVVGLGIIIAYAIMSVKKASARCAELGIESDVIKNVVKSTVVSSIVPSLAILLGFITLTVSLGAALPWWPPCWGSGQKKRRRPWQSSRTGKKQSFRSGMITGRKAGAFRSGIRAGMGPVGLLPV